MKDTDFKNRNFKKSDTQRYKNKNKKTIQKKLRNIEKRHPFTNRCNMFPCLFKKIRHENYFLVCCCVGIAYGPGPANPFFGRNFETASWANFNTEEETSLLSTTR